MRGRAGIDQVIDMQGCFVRADNGRRYVPAPHIAPCLCIAIDVAMAPADHGVSAIEIDVAQMLGSDEVRQIFPRRRHRHDQADMHAVVFNKYRNAAFGFAPIGICRDETSDQRGYEVDTDNQQWPAYYRPQGASKAVDAKQFQV